MTSIEFTKSTGLISPFIFTKISFFLIIELVVGYSGDTSQEIVIEFYLKQ